MTFQALPGFRDFPPEELALRSHIFQAWRRVASRYGFQEYDGPPLEMLDLYTSKSGEEIVGQLYNFTDKGGREVALRPEMTPTLARMVAARANALKKPIRWYSLPQLFRYERQQRGRLREHFQLNCDLIGEAGPLADAEVIALAIDVMRELGLSHQDVRVRVSDRRILAALIRGAGLDDAAVAVAFSAIDRIEKDRDGALRLLMEALTPAQVEHVVAVSELRSRDAVVSELSRMGDHGDEASPLLDTLAALDAMGLGQWLDLDMTIVRGLAYYTGTVFELFDAGKSLRAICGGGRYDNLLEQLGGVSLPAVGFGMGDVVLGELLKDRGLLPEPPASIDLLLAAVTPEDQPHLLALSHQLRDAGLRVEFVMGSLALGKQLRFADARRARLAVVVGPDDRARGEVQVKDLAGKTQAAVPLSRLAEHCRELLERN